MLYDNQTVINEAFFKKSYTEKMKSKLPDYSPEDKRASGHSGFNSVAVSNADEVKKRLVSSFGAIVGNNTVKTMAGKAVKTFPIIISDNVDPETAVLIKKTTEEQYAQYIELLIGNQIIDASEFVAGDANTGNIAIQALDSISGADFSKRQGFATKTANGDLSLNTVAKNDLLYNLIRQESVSLDIEDPFTQGLLEDAVILPADKSDLFIDYLAENYNDVIIDMLNEDDHDKPSNPSSSHISNPSSSNTDRKDSSKTIDTLSYQSKMPFNTYVNQLAHQGEALISSKLDNTETFFVDTASMDQQMNQRVADILNTNPALKDRFEKATFLLYSYRICGYEYLAYLTQRLGIPVSERVRRQIITQYRADTVRSMRNRQSLVKSGSKFKLKNDRDVLLDTKGLGFNERSAGYIYTDRDAQTLSRMQHLDRGIAKDITHAKVKDALVATVVGTTTGAASAGVAVAAGAAVLSTPFWIAAIVPAVVGSSVYLLARYINRRKHSKVTPNVYGWERVESLINMLDMQRNDVQKQYEVSTGMRDSTPDDIMSSKDLNDAIRAAGFSFADSKVAVSEESLYNFNKVKYSISESDNNSDEIKDIFRPAIFDVNTLKECAEDWNAAYKEVQSDREYQAEIFQESIVSSTVPIKVVKKYEFDPKAPAETVVAPAFSFKDRQAYGSVEYDSRQIKDRRYNQPLIMRINFRERYSDGSFSDNEMSAVIGILGVVTRVPSDEMEEILKSNAENVTMKGVFQPDKNSDKLSVADILIGSRKTKRKNNMQSSEIWNNLEKISKLAVINRMSGKQNNNIANAHIVFSQKEIDDVRNETGVDYLKDKKLAASLMKRYSAFTIMIANDVGERLYTFDDLDSISWNLIPYSAIRSKDSSDQLTAALTKISDRR